jgi:hypothetical protein
VRIGPALLLLGLAACGDDTMAPPDAAPPDLQNRCGPHPVCTNEPPIGATPCDANTFVPCYSAFGDTCRLCYCLADHFFCEGGRYDMAKPLTD